MLAVMLAEMLADLLVVRSADSLVGLWVAMLVVEWADRSVVDLVVTTAESLVVRLDLLEHSRVGLLGLLASW